MGLLALHGSWWRRFGLMLVLAGPALASQPPIQVLDHAIATVHTSADGDTTSEVTLPYHWDRHNPDTPGSATFQIAFSMAQAPTGPMAFSIPQIGSAYEVRLNGALLQRRGNLNAPDTDDYAKAPRYVDVPHSLLRADNLLRIDIRADTGRRAGLSALTLGPEPELRDVYDAVYVPKVIGSMVIALLSLIVGLTAFALWVTQVQTDEKGNTQRDGLYLAACVAALCWALRVGDALVETPPLAWHAWSTLMTCVTACWVAGTVVFCCQVAGWQRPRLLTPMARSAWLFGGVTVLCATLATWLHWGSLLSAWYGTVFALFGLFALRFCWAAMKPGASSMHRAVALAAVLNAAAALRDLMIFRLSDAYGEQVWLRFSSLAFGVALAFVVIHRFRTASSQLRELSASLAARIAQKEAELAKTHEQLAQTAGKQARAAERTRILRDMHDGVGAHLSSAIRQLQSGHADTQQLLQTLRDSLDQLKLSIDAVNMPGGDIGALLAGLRYRLGPRFAASDVELQWQVDKLAILRGYDAPAMRQLQFMLFEAVSNVLQHAQARVLRIEATEIGKAIRLSVIDDGRGFDARRPLRQGLLSMHERAAGIGARLTLESRPGRTVVGITLPEKTG